MNEDSGLDTFMEDHINDGYGHIMDAQDAAADVTPDDVDGSGIGNDVSEFDGEEDTEEQASEPDDSMDGDFDSAMASAGLGTDEDYGGGTHDWECGGE